MQRRNREEIMLALKERDDLADKAMKLERQIDKIKNAPKPVSSSKSPDRNMDSGRSAQLKTERLVEENDYLNQ